MDEDERIPTGNDLVSGRRGGRKGRTGDGGTRVEVGWGMNLISQGWRELIIDEIWNMDNEAGLERGRISMYRYVLYFTGFRG